MLKLVFVCRRREGLTRAVYAERLLSGHVPLALRHHPTMRRYVVNVVEEQDPAAPTPDSIGELWFDTLEDYRDRLYDSAEGQRIIGADVRGFLGAADAYATEEIVHRAPPVAPLGERTAGVKIVVAIRRSPALEPPAFAAHWRKRHVPLVLACEEVRGYATSLVAATLSPGAGSIDGFAELWFASEADLARHLARARDPLDPIAEDVGRFVGGATLHRVAEYVER